MARLVQNHTAGLRIDPRQPGPEVLALTPLTAPSLNIPSSPTRHYSRFLEVLFSANLFPWFFLLRNFVSWPDLLTAHFLLPLCSSYTIALIFLDATGLSLASGPLHLPLCRPDSHRAEALSFRFQISVFPAQHVIAYPHSYPPRPSF